MAPSKGYSITPPPVAESQIINLHSGDTRVGFITKASAVVIWRNERYFISHESFNKLAINQSLQVVIVSREYLGKTSKWFATLTTF
jgi:hypothetical protein